MQKRNAFTPIYWAYLKHQLQGQLGFDVRTQVTRALGIKLESSLESSLKFFLYKKNMTAFYEKT